MVPGVTTAPVGVVGHQGDTGVKGDMTGSHQHLRSYAARTLHRGVDYVDATLPHTRAVHDHGVGTRAFLSYRGRRWSPCGSVPWLKGAVAGRRYWRVVLACRYLVVW
jgi:hypothetical protein